VIAAFASWNEHHEAAIQAAAAAHYGHSLISCDRRAATTYDRLDIEVTYL
jgi:hypothetical protein